MLKEDNIVRFKDSKRQSFWSNFFHRQVNHLVSSQVVEDARIIDIGCGDGSLIAACRPALAVGIETDPALIAVARQHNSDFEYLQSHVEDVGVTPLTEPDYVLLSMVLDEVYDVSRVLEKVSEWSTPTTRTVVVTYNRLWKPLLLLAEALRLKTVNSSENYIPWAQLENILETSGFEITKRIDGVLFPVRIPLVSRFVNRWIAPLPLIRHFCLIRVTTVRKKFPLQAPPQSVSIIVAARNEAGNIAEIIRRVPQLAPIQELIFVEGGSTDETWQVIQAAVNSSSPQSFQSLIALQQTGKGKGDAVRAGFAIATGEILMILDADLSVPPEELHRFVEAISGDACEFANGSRLVYPMDEKAMRFLNILGNKFFAQAFEYLLGQPVGDTLCGTKVLRRSDYERISNNRKTFGDFDPFGDFDLLFGASKLSLRIRDIPVHYKERTYGTTNISRFSHGLLLVRMCALAAKKLKFVG